MNHGVGGQLLDAVPLLVPVAAVVGVLGPDAWRSLRARSPWLAVAAAASVTAAVVHVVVMPAHLGEFWLFGVFFGGLAVVQLGYAGLLALGPSRRLLVAGALVNAATVALWLVSRTTGLPIGPDAGTPEPVGLLDVTSTVAELTLVLSTWLALRDRPWGSAVAPPSGARREPSHRVLPPVPHAPPRATAA